MRVRSGDVHVVGTKPCTGSSYAFYMYFIFSCIKAFDILMQIVTLYNFTSPFIHINPFTMKLGNKMCKLSSFHVALTSCWWHFKQMAAWLNTLCLTKICTQASCTSKSVYTLTCYLFIVIKSVEFSCLSVCIHG